MRWTRVRDTAAAVTGLLLMLIAATVATGLFGWEIPGLKALAKLLGVPGAE